jgi:Zn-dependent peptidase ImmA (M78 family)/DNA-binding XRE family transcriptional regulator
MMDLQQADPRLVGQRLVAARKARGVTQEEAAAHLGCSRPTLIAIEKGDRRPTEEEIVKLASFYGRSVHEIVRPGVEVVEFAPHLRAVVPSGSPSANDLDCAIGELQSFAEDYRELERVLDAKPVHAYPPEITPPERGNLVDFAADVAMRERERLGLGSEPILNLRQVLETEVGLRVFYGKMPSNIAGMFAYTAELGFCVYINGNHPIEKRRATLAHEYGHSLCDRHKPGIDYTDGNGRKPASERFAESFGLSFLMPASGVRRKFHDIAESTGDFKVADLCRLSAYFCVAVQAMTLRLEELGLIAKGTWDLLSDEGFKPRKAREELGLALNVAESGEQYPERYKFLAVQAFQASKVSEGQLARFLRCDRVRAREVVATCRDQSFVDSNGHTLARMMPFGESLLRGRA